MSAVIAIEKSCKHDKKVHAVLIQEGTCHTGKEMSIMLSLRWIFSCVVTFVNIFQAVYAEQR